MNRLSSWAVPIILALAGIALIIAGTLDLEPRTSELPPIATASPTGVPAVTASPSPSLERSEGASAEPTSTPQPTATATPTPMPSSVTAVQLQVPAVGINVAVRQSTTQEIDEFPPSDAAYILRSGTQPGRNRNAYIFAHAIETLFKPLWNARIGDEVLIRMSDDSVRRYLITEVRPNVACPDPDATENNPPNPPLALQIHDNCDQGAFWTAQTEYERLTLQTSQGYNRNWGELVIIAEPA